MQHLRRNTHLKPLCDRKKSFAEYPAFIPACANMAKKAACFPAVMRKTGSFYNICLERSKSNIPQ